MRNVMRKIPSILLAVVFVLLLGVGAQAAETRATGNWTYTLGTGGCTITGYTGNSSDVNIPATLDGYRVSAIAARAFKDKTTIKTLTIPETITSIGAEAFRNCVGLSQIYFNAKNCTVPEIWQYDSARGVGVFSGAGSAAMSLNVTFGPNVKNIPANLFNTDAENRYDYAHITSVTFSENLKTIDKYAFQNCRALETLTLTDEVTTIDDAAFQDCISLTKITLGDELQRIGISAFENCTALEQIVWGSGLDTIDDFAFKGCSSLEEAHIPQPATVIGNEAFMNAVKLEEITIPLTVTSIEAEAFAGTIKLSVINFNAKDCSVPEIWRYDDNRGVGVFSGAGSGAVSLKVIFGSSVKNIPANLFNTDRENGYSMCYLSDIQFGNGVEVIGSSAFENCECLETVTFGANVKTIGGNAFLKCIGIESMTMNNKLATIGTSAFNGCTTLEEITWGTGLDTIGESAFESCTSLIQANIPYPATSIGRHAFYNNTSLELVTIPKSVTKIGAEAFYNTIKLKQINYNATNCVVPEIWRHSDDKGVGVFSGAGSGAASLKVTFGSSVKNIPANLFNTDRENGYSMCYLSDIQFGNGVEVIGSSAFENCECLETVTFGANVKTIGDTAFLKCIGIKSITMSKKLATIGTSAFNGCTALEKISWGTGLDTIGESAFESCTSLIQANIPYPATSIGRHAFYNNTSLELVTIPKSVTKIGAEAFYNTTKLEQINYNATKCIVPEIWRHSDDKGVGVFCGAGSGTNTLKVVFGSTVNVIPANLFNTDKENGSDHCYVTSISIPENVKEIGGSAFENCQKLTSVSYTRNVSTIGENVFNDCVSSPVVKCYYGSTIHTYASQNGLKCTYYTPKATTMKSVTNQAKGIRIQWNAAVGASKYYIYRKTSASGAWKQLKAVSNSTLSYVDTSVKAGQTYFYTVRAYAPNGLYGAYMQAGLKIAAMKITTQPVTKYMLTGKTAKFTVKAAGAGLKYQWQYRTSSTGKWKAATTAGKKTATLSVPTTAAKNGYQFRCKITDKYGSVIYSNVATLKIVTLKFTTQPASVTVARGKTATFKVVAKGTGLKYQWQYRTSYKTSWKKLSATGSKTANLKIPATAAKNGYQYRCVITDKYGNSLTSAAATLKVK